MAVLVALATPACVVGSPYHALRGQPYGMAARDLMAGVRPDKVRPWHGLPRPFVWVDLPFALVADTLLLPVALTAAGVEEALRWARPGTEPPRSAAPRLDLGAAHRALLLAGAFEDGACPPSILVTRVTDITRAHRELRARLGDGAAALASADVLAGEASAALEGAALLRRLHRPHLARTILENHADSLALAGEAVTQEALRARLREVLAPVRAALADEE